MHTSYCAYDESSGHYAYYTGSGTARVQLPPQRAAFVDYRDVEVLLPEDARPIGSGLHPKGILVQPNQVVCMPPCQKPASERATWNYFLWGLRFLFW